MKVKLLTARATSRGAENRGDEVEVSEAEAIRMIECGQAEAVRSAAKPETAIKPSKFEKASK